MADPFSLFDSSDQRKARGAYFTPAKVSKFLSEWAVRSEFDRVLEPSCGEASFLLAAANRLRAIRKPREMLLFDGQDQKDQLVGIEIHSASATQAGSLLSKSNVPFRIDTADFFDVKPTPTFNAVLGNPPFIRYQSFTGDARSKGLRAALAAGVNLNGLASSWAAFVVHASGFLTKSGRLGMVLPAELLSVHYAAPVRRFLLKRFSSIRIVLFERLLFDGALEDVVLLLADGIGGCDRIEAVQVRDADALPPGDSITVAMKQLHDDRWVATMVKPAAWKTFSRVAAGENCETLNDWGSTYLGAVTGNNNFFCLSDAEVAHWEITKDDLLPISPPGSRHLRDLEFGTKSWEQLKGAGSRCWLFYPQAEKTALGRAAVAYVAHGESLGVPKAYKCSVRKPWWKVPLVSRPHLFLTYMDHERPRFVTNGAGAHHLNSLYGVSLKSGRKLIGEKLLPLATLNTVTLLGAEVHGRSYGGGMLKLEPREAGRIPVPRLSHLAARQMELEAIRPHVAKALAQGELARALNLVDLVLWDSVPNARTVLGSLQEARELLFQRRHSRSRGSDND